jgi:hypothetical protein
MLLSALNYVIKSITVIDFINIMEIACETPFWQDGSDRKHHAILTLAGVAPSKAGAMCSELRSEG